MMKTIAILALAGAAFVVASCQQQVSETTTTPPLTIVQTKK